MRSPSGKLSTLAVLVVEDDELSAALATAFLNLFGCSHVRVDSGEAAVAAAAARHFDVILMDYHLKGMNGVSATRHIRADEATRGVPRTAILGLTASAMPHEVAQLREAGMDDVVTKPVLLPVLQQKLVEWSNPPPPACD